MILELLTLIEKMGINLINFIEPISPILDGFGRKYRQETVYILSSIPLYIICQELFNLFLRGDEVTRLCLNNSFFRFNGRTGIDEKKSDGNTPLLEITWNVIFVKGLGIV